MDLDEFKDFWQLDQEKDLKENKHSSHHINQILMKTTTTLGKLEKTNKYWLKVMLILVPAALVILIIGSLRHTGGEAPQDPSFQQSLLFNLILLGFVLMTAFLYYWQYKIFHFSPTVDIKTGLRSAIRGFYTFYAVSSVLYAPFFFIVAFVMAQVFSRPFTSSLDLPTNVVLAGLFTVLALLGNHRYYQKKYFKWVNDLKQNLKELEGENRE
ncbi:hypothetical protein BH24BAC1_BH24BAC1_19630 [soil metagenome]